MARDKAQLSRTISSLERRGLVVRAPNAADQRSILLSLTDKGDAMVEGIKAALTDILGGILEPLSAAKRAQLLDLLKQL